MTSKKILVVGSNSFSGACFVDYALRQGAAVFGTSRSAQPHTAFLPYQWKGLEKNFRFYQYDLNHHLDETMKLILDERIGTIVNFAAQSMVGQSWEYPEHWYQTNVVSAAKFHNALRGIDFLDRYVHITTPEVYGSTDGFITEDTPYNPSTPYAVSRAAADMNLKCFFDAYQFPVVSTRAANVYGPGQQLYRIIPRTILFARLGKKMELHGGGVSRRSFIHMEDVSDATWRIMERGTIGQTYHISTNEIVTIRQLVEMIAGKMGMTLEDLANVGEERLGKDAAYMLDSTKLRRELGWEDKISLDEGLNDCIKNIDLHLDALRALPSFDYQHKP